MSKPDYYEVLGVSSDSNETEIKKAYRSLSLKFHPDRNSDVGAKEKFQEISDAYETLGDSQKRKEYDHQKQFGGQGHHPGFPFPGGFPFGGVHGMPHHVNVENIFEQFFHGGGIHMMHQQGGPNIQVFHNGRNVFVRKKPDPVMKTIHVSLESSFHGATVDIEIERTEVQNGAHVSVRDRVSAPIPRGIKHGQKILLKDLGCIENNERGDLELTFHIDDHPFFVRRENDLVYKSKISLKEALCGFSLEILHLSGKTLRLSNNNQVIHTGYNRIINGLGMILDNNECGNLIIEFEVEFPKTIDETQRTQLLEILK